MSMTPRSIAVIAKQSPNSYLGVSISDIRPRRHAERMRPQLVGPKRDIPDATIHLWSVKRQHSQMQPSRSTGSEPTAELRRRKCERHIIGLTALAFVTGQPHRALIADLSRQGARLLGPKLPRVGSELLLIVGGQTAFAKVAWRDDSACGLSFYHHLCGGEMEQFQREGTLLG